MQTRDEKARPSTYSPPFVVRHKRINFLDTMLRRCYRPDPASQRSHTIMLVPRGPILGSGQVSHRLLFRVIGIAAFLASASLAASTICKNEAGSNRIEAIDSVTGAVMRSFNP